MLEVMVIKGLISEPCYGVINLPLFSPLSGPLRDELRRERSATQSTPCFHLRLLYLTGASLRCLMVYPGFVSWASFFFSRDLVA